MTETVDSCPVPPRVGRSGKKIIDAIRLGQRAADTLRQLQQHGIIEYSPVPIVPTNHLWRRKVYLLLGSRILMHLMQTSHSGDFWGWIYSRVRDAEPRDYQNKTLVWYLPYDAINARESIRALAIYRDFQPMIDKEATPEVRQKIVDCIDEAEKLTHGEKVSPADE